MVTTTRHINISIRGVLRWKDTRLRSLFTNDDGSKATAADIKEFLMNKLVDGWEVLPFGEPCEGFDKKTGCPGHKH